MAENKKYNSILVSGRKDETLTYSRYIKDEETGKSVKESLDGKINTTDKLETHQIKDGAITNEKLADDSVSDRNIQAGSVGTNEIGDQVITIEKIAAEVWSKLKDEYLRLDGKNSMYSNLNLNNNKIIGITELHDDKSLPSVIAFNKDGYDIKFEKYSTSGGDEGASPDFLGGINDTEFKVPLFMIANGFKTHNRTTLGLLNNDGEVVTAMTDSDIDSCISSVFG